MPYKLKTDEAGNAVLKDGIPVWVENDDDEGTPIDVNAWADRIQRNNRQNETQKKKLRELEERYGPLKDVEDIEAFLQEAEKARDTIKNLEEKDVRKAETVEKIKQEMRDGFADKEKKLKAEFGTKLDEMQKQIDGKDGTIRKLMVSNRFATCDLFVGEDRKTTLPPDAAEALFGQHFKVEERDGKTVLVAYYNNGDQVYSRERPGEPADFNEAIRSLFDRYPHKDSVLRTTPGGSGGTGGTTGVIKPNSLAQLQKRLAETTQPVERIRLTNEIHALQMKSLQGAGG